MECFIEGFGCFGNPLPGCETCPGYPDNPIKKPCERCEESGIEFDNETGLGRTCPDCNGGGVL